MNGLARRLLLLAIIACVCPCASGCIFFAYPRLHYVPSAKIESEDDTVWVFECRSSTGSYIIESEQSVVREGDRTPDVLETSWSTYAALIPIPPTHDVEQHYVLVYRPDYKTKMIESWDLFPDMKWEATESVVEDEASVDSILTICDYLPWAQRLPMYEKHLLLMPKYFNESWDVCAGRRTPEMNKRIIASYQEEIEFALKRYAYLLDLARSRSTEEVVGKTRVVLSRTVGESKDEFRQVQYTSAEAELERADTIERLAAKVDFLTAALNYYSDGVPEEIALTNDSVIER
jgi:hypothetical protein